MGAASFCSGAALDAVLGLQDATTSERARRRTTLSFMATSRLGLKQDSDSNAIIYNLYHTLEVTPADIIDAMSHTMQRLCEVAVSPTRAKGHLPERRATAPRSSRHLLRAPMHTSRCYTVSMIEQYDSRIFMDQIPLQNVTTSSDDAF